jgi:O-antigen ligase
MMIRGLQLMALAELLRPVQLWITVAALALAPLFFGSIDQLAVVIWIVVLSIGTLFGLAVPMGARQARLLFVFFILCFVYALVAVIQIAPDRFGKFNDPIWLKANQLLGLNTPPRISILAEIPSVAVGHFLLLVTSFMNGFFVGTSQRNAYTLVWWARASILVYVIYGLVALALTPNLLLWAPKLAYQGYLTATFVNHNTAATFIGAGCILWFCWAYLPLQSLPWSSLRLLLLTPSNEHLAFKLIVRSAGALTCLFALLLTGSRGGLICSSAGLLVAIGLMAVNKTKPKLWYIIASGIGALALAVAWLSQTGRIGSQGFFDDARLSVYGLCIDAIRQRPLLGSGAGSFEELFPSLRTENLSLWGVWDYAHSTVLEIAVEMGLPAAAMVVIASLASIIILVRAALNSKDGDHASLASIAGIAVLSYLHSMIDFSLQIPGYLIVFAILLGCGLSRSSATRAAIEKPRSRTQTAIKGD